MLLALVGVLAIATPSCPDHRAQVERAWSVFLQGELDEARRLLQQAEAALPCQTSLVDPTNLLELFQMRALVAFTNDQPNQVEVALQGAIAVDHTPAGRPPLKYGPELITQWEALAAEARERLITVTIDGDFPAWVDGRSVEASSPLQVAAGQHLVQITDGEGQVSSRVVQLLVSQAIATGRAPVVETAPPPPPPQPAPVEPRSRRHRHPAWAFVTAVSAAGATWAIASGVRSEQSFQASPYQALVFNGCPRGAACYPAARREAIRTDAARVNRVYATGYGLAALTSGLLTVTIVGLPRRSRNR